MAESVEQFLARGGRIERDLPAPRAVKCALPHGAAVAPKGHSKALPDMRRPGNKRRKGWRE